MNEQPEYIDFAPYGWGVYELGCVNCKKEWVSVAPAYITDITDCPYCGKKIDIYQPTFQERTPSIISRIIQYLNRIFNR